ALGRLQTPEQFRAIILRSNVDGSVLRLGDVARVELGQASYGTSALYNGKPASGFGVSLSTTGNALDAARSIEELLARLKPTFPAGVKSVVAYDTTPYVRKSIVQVIKTLIEAVIIVIAVIFFFLQDWRATLIPAVTIPVSLVGTFAFIRVFGFSINSLTLFGITLATGLVVDDAIVVIENVQRHIQEGDNEPHHATSAAMGEVTSAVIATSLVLIAVFVPVSFFPGTTGILYRQFSLTIAFSIAISAFNALTLSPSLAALLLKRDDGKHTILHLAERSIKALGRGYASAIHGVLRIRWIMLLLFFVGLFGAYWEYTHVPTGFVPEEDQGFMMVLVQAPQGASLAYTTGIEAQVSALLKQDKDVAGAFAVGGFSFSGNAPNFGMMFCSLAPYENREGPGHSAAEIIGRLQQKFFMIPGAMIYAFAPPAISGVGTLGGFQFELQDLGGNSITDLDRTAHLIVAKANQNPNLTRVLTSFTSNDPQVLVRIDRDKAKALGVPFSQISDALQVYMGSAYVNNFDFNNRNYRVYVQAEQQFRQNASDIRQFYVRSSTGQMISLDNLVTIENTSGPQVISHYNLFRSAEIDGNAAPGVSTSVALHSMEQVADQNMMHGMAYQWTGLALEEIESAGKAVVIFGLGILVVYLTLAALYESFALPFIILLAVPMAVLGALFAQSMRGYADDIYCQIGLVMLIGLAAKNSILIVEFAEQLRAKGRSLVEAAVEAAELRLRPILMTSFAFILGVIPLAIASGAGAQGRRSVGTTIIGGMLVSTLLNLFFIPVLYIMLQTLLGKFGSGRSARRPAQSADTGAYVTSGSGTHS
ncbi:MAG TPA: efflux RND transporter permease subunit, partial [Acidobacteriaceae bacterium]|nr:efflux RND transporter permease subunit [Acidobacteriaceae bacterium]